MNEQPEEWESRFEREFIVMYSGDQKQVKSFIKEEIRKAEEKAYNKAIKKLTDVGFTKEQAEVLIGVMERTSFGGLF